MFLMIKTLLTTIGAVLMAVSALPAAPGGRSFAVARGGSPSFNRPAARVSPQFATARRGYGYRGYRGGYYGHGYGHRHRYYLYGVPYFYDPFFFGGLGYYGGGYGGYPYGSGYGYDGAYGNGYYNGRVVDSRDNDDDDDNANVRQNASGLPKAVQKQLAQRGYYKGSIDGEFGPGSRSALSRFQRDNDLKATGRIDSATMKALGFEERD